MKKVVIGLAGAVLLGTFAFGATEDNSTPEKRMANFIHKLKTDPKYKDGKSNAYYVPINKPEYFVFAPRQSWDLKKRDNSLPGDLYNDHFQVIYKEQNGMLFAFWTQATKEMDIDQHIAFSKSADKGLTWTEPVILAGSPNKKNPMLIASWQQPMISKSGRIYCLWNQQVTSNPHGHFGNMFGIYSDDDGDTWSAPKMVYMKRMDLDSKDITVPPKWCNWQRPLRLGEGGKYFVGMSRHGQAPYDKRHGCKIEFLQFDNIDDDPEVDKIKLSHFATNKDALTIKPVNDYEPACEEAAIVKLPDGRLFALMRSSIGHPVWSQSRDNGRTWTEPKILLNKDGGKAYLHPRSPCPIYDWKGCEAGSGKYFAFIHNTFDPTQKTAYQKRGPLYLIAGTFNPNAEQPIEFAEPKLFAPRKDGNSFYTSYTYFDGKGILWFNCGKFFLFGREIGEEWFK